MKKMRAELKWHNKKHPRWWLFQYSRRYEGLKFYGKGTQSQILCEIWEVYRTLFLQKTAGRLLLIPSNILNVHLALLTINQLNYSLLSRASWTSCSPSGNYMFKVNNRNTRTRCEICSKLIGVQKDIEITVF